MIAPTPLAPLLALQLALLALPRV
jgi:hypothetical protein